MLNKHLIGISEKESIENERFEKRERYSPSPEVFESSGYQSTLIWLYPNGISALQLRKKKKITDYPITWEAFGKCRPMGPIPRDPGCGVGMCILKAPYWEILSPQILMTQLHQLVGPRGAPLHRHELQMDSLLFVLNHSADSVYSFLGQMCLMWPDPGHNNNIRGFCFT